MIIPRGLLLLQSLSHHASGGPPSTLRPAGPAAAAIARLGTGMIIAAAIVFVVVVTLMIWPMFRYSDETQDQPRTIDEHAWEFRWIIIGGGAIPMLILAGVFVLSIAAMGAERVPATAYDVEVIGHQWWWEVRYPRDGITSANEVHIPVGQPVRVRLLSGDVIHSFWVPQLQGKTDAITGQTNETWLQAARPGVYRGECAEFCGREHAHMAFVVVAQSPSDYAAWQANERREAATPTDSSALVGETVFLTSACAMCHTVRGTRAGARIGPDLTHLASRHTLASGTIDFTRGNLAAWIVNPDRIKPGTTMPPVPLDGATLGALVAYLETLR
jgi:cytochrome c oxidase subunit II